MTMDSVAIEADARAGSAVKRKMLAPRLIFPGGSSLIWGANRAPLQHADLLRLPDDLHAANNLLSQEWRAEVARAKKKHAALTAAHPDDTPPRKPPKGSLLNAIWPLIKPALVVSFLLQVTASTLQFGGPLIIQHTLRAVERIELCAAEARSNATLATNGTLSEGEILHVRSTDIPFSCRVPEVYYGYALTVVIFFVKLLESFAMFHSQFRMTHLALRLRSMLIGSIYRKCLRLASIGKANIGQIQTLMAVDCQFFVFFAPMVNQGFVMPFQILACFIWLGFIVGPSVIMCVAVVCVVMPVQTRLGRAMLTLRRAQLKCADERVKLVNEMIQGMRVIKMYAWEESMMARIMAVRKKEVAVMTKLRVVNSCMATMIMMAPFAMTVTMFAMYTGLGNELEASRVLSALSIVGVLRFPLGLGPIIFAQVANFLVSLNRIGTFLNNEELPSTPGSTLVADELLSPHLGDLSPGDLSPGDRGAHPSVAIAATLSGCTLYPVPCTLDPVPIAATLSGSFKWEPPELPAKGKGKGKGRAKGPGAKGPGAKGPGAKGPGAKGPGAEGPGAEGQAEGQAAGGRGACGGRLGYLSKTRAWTIGGGAGQGSTPTASKAGRGRGRGGGEVPSAPQASKEVVPAKGGGGGGKGKGGPEVSGPTLKDLNIAIKQGKLTMITGAVGCGTPSCGVKVTSLTKPLSPSAPRPASPQPLTLSSVPLATDHQASRAPSRRCSVRCLTD